jgi:hypothetical protein
MTELVRQQPRPPYRKYTQEQMIKALEESRGLIAPADSAGSEGTRLLQGYDQELPRRIQRCCAS